MSSWPSRVHGTAGVGGCVRESVPIGSRQPCRRHHLTGCARLGQFDRLAGFDVARQLPRLRRGQAYAERGQGLPRDRGHAGRGPSLVGASQTPQNSSGVASALVFDLAGHTALSTSAPVSWSPVSSSTE
jgi:hypothetical protein